ncbi:MAG: polyketide cyclase [Pseudomonadota bacterium]
MKTLAYCLVAAFLGTQASALASESTSNGEMNVGKAMIAEGTNRNFSHTLETSNPDEIWRLWTTPSTWGDWDQGLKSASMDEPMRLGSLGEIVPHQGSVARFTVTEFSANQSCTFETKLPMAVLRVSRSFNVDRTAFTHTVSFHGVSAIPLSTVLGPGFRKALPPTMETLNRLAAGG